MHQSPGCQRTIFVVPTVRYFFVVWFTTYLRADLHWEPGASCGQKGKNISLRGPNLSWALCNGPIEVSKGMMTELQRVVVSKTFGSPTRASFRSPDAVCGRYCFSPSGKRKTVPCLQECAEFLLKTFDLQLAGLQCCTKSTGKDTKFIRMSRLGWNVHMVSKMKKHHNSEVSHFFSRCMKIWHSGYDTVCPQDFIATIVPHSFASQAVPLGDADVSAKETKAAWSIWGFS